MMRAKNFFPGGCAAAGMLILILDGRTALAGAQAGMDLCIKTVIPSLFPFLLLSILLTNTVYGSDLSILRPLGRLCSVPEGTESVLLTGFLGGYPVGAQSAAAAYASGGITKQDADRMLAFCSNAGPAFLFGMVSGMFTDPSAPFLLWGIHIGSALLVAMLLPAASCRQAVTPARSTIALSGAMRSAITVMASVCGWVFLFRVVIVFLDRWILWILPSAVRVILVGVLELSNGSCELSAIADPQLRFVICSGMLSFGGLCVTMQTQSVAAGLSMGSYLKGKLLQTLFSLLLSAAVVLHIWIPAAALLILFAGIIRKAQKRSGNPAAVGV